MTEFKSCIKCGEEKVDHEPEHINYKQYDTCVDKELVDLLKILWEKEIATNFSCIGENCPCDVSTCRVGMTQIVFWSDDHLYKFLKPFLGYDFLSDYELFFNIHDFKKNFTIVSSVDDIYDPNRKSTVWRWEPMSPAAPQSDNKQDTIEGVPIPSQYSTSIRWELRFPKKDISKVIKVLTNKKYIEREITHYLLKDKKVEVIGSLSLKNGEIISTGIYSEVQNFNEAKAASDYEENREYWLNADMSYEDFLKASKKRHEDAFINYKSSKEDLLPLIQDIKDSYVIINNK